MHPNTAWRRFGLLLLGCTLALGVRAVPDKRVALVVGNAAYVTAAPLSNPARDARAVAAELRRLGFDVIEAIDAGKESLDQSVAELRNRLGSGGASALVYYAGHAIQLEWRNYLVPVDARLSRPQDVPRQTVDLQAILEVLRQARTRVNIVVLDACRDNPFGATGRGLGLAPLDAPHGTYLAYATAPGNVAEDGDEQSGHSLFTYHLLQELRKPRSRIEDVFKRVRLQVRQQTQGRQIPWDSSSLEDEFAFDAGVAPAALPPPWERDREFAQQRAEWDRVSASTEPEAVFDYLRRFPSGMFSALAQARIDALQSPKVRPAADARGQVEDNWREALRDGDEAWYYTISGYTGRMTGHAFLKARLEGDSIVEYWGRGPAAVPTLRATRWGFTTEDESGSYDPPVPVVPEGGIWRIGDTTRTRSVWTPSSGTPQWIDFELRVEARETVEVPLGRFETYRVVLRGVRQDGTRLVRTTWFEPGWYAPVKWVQEIRGTRDSTPDVTRRELSWRQRAETATR